MSKFLLIAGLLVGLGGTLRAQTKADRVFNMPEKYIYNTHRVHLRGDGLLTIEMADVTDYEMLKNLDSILNRALDDIAFYKDSIQPTDNVRIDYTLQKESDNIMIRFKKYKADGDVFVKKGNELSRLKLEQDTVRILLKKPEKERDSHMHFYDFPVQLTFLVNNYTDLNTLVGDKGMLSHIADTLSSVTQPKVYDPAISRHRTNIDFYPYRIGRTLTKTEMEDGEIVGKK